MPKSIFKYPLPSEGERVGRAELVKVEMPIGSKVLKVGLQHGLAQIWAEVDPGKATLSREFIIVGTGYEVPHDEIDGELNYLDTLMFSDGYLVLHVYEVKRGND